MKIIHDYHLRSSGLWIDTDGGGMGDMDQDAATLEEVAAVLFMKGFIDGYTLLTGEVVCIMDDRSGFPSGHATVQQVWESIGGDLQEQVAQICLQ